MPWTLVSLEAWLETPRVEGGPRRGPRRVWLQVLHFFILRLDFQFTHYSIFLHALYTHHTARGKRHMHSTVLILGSTRAFSLYSLMVNASFTYSTLYPPSLRRSLVSVVAQRSYSVQVPATH